MSMKLPHGAAAVRDSDEFSASVITSGRASMVIALAAIAVVALVIYWFVRSRAAKRAADEGSHPPDPLPD